MNDELRRRDLGLNYYCLLSSLNNLHHLAIHLSLHFPFPYLNVPESKPSKRVDPWVYIQSRDLIQNGFLVCGTMSSGAPNSTLSSCFGFP
jgi:hypothetical protein